MFRVKSFVYKLKLQMQEIDKEEEMNFDAFKLDVLN
jgi:hypothetical protein